VKKAAAGSGPLFQIRIATSFATLRYE